MAVFLLLLAFLVETAQAAGPNQGAGVDAGAGLLMEVLHVAGVALFGAHKTVEFVRHHGIGRRSVRDDRNTPSLPAGDQSSGHSSGNAGTGRKPHGCTLLAVVGLALWLAGLLAGLTWLNVLGMSLVLLSHCTECSCGLIDSLLRR